MNYNFLLRKSIHLLYGTCVAMISYLNEDLRLFSIVLTSILTILYLIYIFTGLKLKFAEKYLRLLSEEKVDVKAICYALGIISSLIFFEQEIMVSSILILSLSDSLAAFSGKYLFKTENKSVFGSSVHFLSDFLILINFFPIHLALVTSLIASTVEHVVGKFENLLVPMLVGVFLTFITS